MSTESTLEEKPAAKATGMKGAVWMAKDTPIHLHIFEYIVRNAILSWWKSAASQSD
jgi:hypothetical protein